MILSAFVCLISSHGTSTRLLYEKVFNFVLSFFHFVSVHYHFIALFVAPFLRVYSLAILERQTGFCIEIPHCYGRECWELSQCREFKRFLHNKTRTVFYVSKNDTGREKVNVCETNTDAVAALEGL